MTRTAAEQAFLDSVRLVWWRGTTPYELQPLGWVAHAIAADRTITIVRETKREAAEVAIAMGLLSVREEQGAA